MPLIVETYPAETPYSQTIYPQKYRNCFHIYPDLWPENTPGSEDCCESEIADHEADTIAGFLLEKEDILSEISGKTIVFHCISPIISAFAAELLRRGQTVIVLLPEMNPELIQKIFSDSDDRDLMEFSPPSRPIHVTKFPSFHALKERSDRQFYTPVLTAKKRKESPTLSDMLIHWQDILHNDDACRAFSVLQGLLDPDEGPDGWRHTLVHFLDKLPDVLAADEDSPLSLLRLTAPYAAAYAASDAEIFLGALEVYLLTSEYTEPDALPPNLFDFLSDFFGICWIWIIHCFSKINQD